MIKTNHAGDINIHKLLAKLCRKKMNKKTVQEAPFVVLF